MTSFTHARQLWAEKHGEEYPLGDAGLRQALADARDGSDEIVLHEMRKQIERSYQGGA